MEMAGGSVLVARTGLPRWVYPAAVVAWQIVGVAITATASHSQAQPRPLFNGRDLTAGIPTSPRPTARRSWRRSRCAVRGARRAPRDRR